MISARLKLLDVIKNEKNNIALYCSLKEVNDGRYDLINRIYYNQLSQIYEGTPYAELSAFYAKRDLQIALNIVNTVKQNPNKKLIFLVGADHREYASNQLKTIFGNEIVLNKF